MMKKILLLFVLIFLGLNFYILHEVYSFLTQPPENPGREKIVTIRPGMNFHRVARLLEEESIVTSSWKFRFYGKLAEKDHMVKAGEFKLSTAWNPKEVLEELTTGQPILHKLVIPEGLTWWQTAELVAESGLTTFDAFSRVLDDQELLDHYAIPTDKAEGFLFPETYLLPRPQDQDARPIVEAMLSMFWEKTVPELWPDRNLDPEQLQSAVTLASLVEKETSLPKERPLVAGVYANRMERSMLMQADPTVIYGLGPDFGGNLKKTHLRDRTNPYNTYRLPGLPPGPICSPGLESLKAALSPAEHNYLYFVSRGDGSHHFSKTLSEHNRAVYKYQIRRKR